jgi:hypothetical protein
MPLLQPWAPPRARRRGPQASEALRSATRRQTPQRENLPLDYSYKEPRRRLPSAVSGPQNRRRGLRIGPAALLGLSKYCSRRERGKGENERFRSSLSSKLTLSIWIEEGARPHGSFNFRWRTNLGTGVHVMMWTRMFGETHACQRQNMPARITSRTRFFRSTRR